MLKLVKRIIPRRLFKALQPPYHFLVAFSAALAYGFPSRKLIVIGVTGTAGKTSTVYMIARMLSAAGYKTGLTSTASFSDGDTERLNDKKMTMPGRFFIQKALSRMVKNGCRYAVIETTSEGIRQFRHRFIDYDAAVFTGLYPEHIESHGSFEKYKEAKGRLFAHLKKCATKYADDKKAIVNIDNNLKKLDLNRISKAIIVNGDDRFADYFLNFWSEAKLAYSLRTETDAPEYLNNLSGEAAVKDFTLVKGSDVVASPEGISFAVDGQTVNLHLLGEYNAYNAMAAYAVGLSQKLAPEKIIAGLESVHGFAGKLEVIHAGQDFTAIVDYSFEPKALEKLYQAVSLLPRRKIIHLLGSTGGGRDKSRRPILGRIAAEKADIVIVANEDPYDEDPIEIIDQVASGAEAAGKTIGVDLFKIIDRREAIKKALMLAEEGDMVLFTGKGAEQYICVANEQKIPWDERKIVREEILDKLARKGTENSERPGFNSESGSDS